MSQGWLVGAPRATVSHAVVVGISHAHVARMQEMHGSFKRGTDRRRFGCETVPAPAKLSRLQATPSREVRVFALGPRPSQPVPIPAAATAPHRHSQPEVPSPTEQASGWP